TFRASRSRVTTKSREGNTENCSGSMVNMVVSKMMTLTVRLNVKATSRTRGDIGMTIIKIMAITQAAINRSLWPRQDRQLPIKPEFGPGIYLTSESELTPHAVEHGQDFRHGLVQFRRDFLSNFHMLVNKLRHGLVFHNGNPVFLGLFFNPFRNHSGPFRQKQRSAVPMHVIF